MSAKEMKDLSLLLNVRRGEENDRNFIMATWLRGLYYGNSWFKEIDKDIFMANYHSIITNVLESPNTLIQVAVLNEDTDVILGYSIIGHLKFRKNVYGRVLHWVFVKDAWRRLGIAKSLVPDDIDAATHLTAIGKQLKPKSMIFNPFLL